MWWCWGKGTSVICWRITRPTTTGCARTLRSTRMLRSIDLRRQSGLSHQSLGSAVSIGTTFGWHNRYAQGTLPRSTLRPASVQWSASWRVSPSRAAQVERGGWSPTPIFQTELEELGQRDATLHAKAKRATGDLAGRDQKRCRYGIGNLCRNLPG